jgi:hypothetical protein
LVCGLYTAGIDFFRCASGVLRNSLKESHMA